MRDLPVTIERCCSRWKISPVHQFPSTFNFVCAMRREDGVPVVLKICFPGSREYWSECQALGLLAENRDVVDILERWDEPNAFLLDWVMPGSSLRRLVPSHDDKATEVAGQLMPTFWVEVQSIGHLVDIRQFAQDFGEYRGDHGESGPVPQRHVDRAESLFRELAQSMTRTTLLHGDLHHDNVLATEDAWVIIDPKGMVGEPEFEVAAFLRSPPHELAGEASLRRLLARRLDQLSVLALDMERARAWSYTQAVLLGISAAYGGDPIWIDYSIACAEALV